MNAIDVLKQDHDKVKQLFQRFESSDDESLHRRLFEEIKTELQIHSHIEEAVFYPVVEEKDDELNEMVQEAYDEHAEVNDLLVEIEDLNREGSDLRSKVIELKDIVEHHVQEEENEMFPKVRQAMGEEELSRMGEELAAEKRTSSSAA
jgi:hemerythrin superfamily protein